MQRWLRFIPYLVRDGWDIHVLTTSNGDYPYRDDSLTDELPNSVKVHKTAVPALSKLWKLIFGKGSELPQGDLRTSGQDPLLKRILIWIRLNLIIPDMRVFWVPSAYRKASQLVRVHGINMLITTGPPHSTHLIGLLLKEKYTIRWIADWRDPWSGIYYLKLSPPSSLSRWIHRSLEAKVCSSADLNLVISEHLQNSLPSGKKLLLRNGFDAEAVSRARQAGGKLTENGFVISYVGQVTAGQDLDALSRILAAISDKPDVRIRFIGSRLSEPQSKILTERLGSGFNVLPFMTHQAALELMATSDLLLLLINCYEGFEGMLTTKLYEYLGMGIPILAVGPRGGEAEALINKYYAGLCVDATEIDSARTWVSDLYNRHNHSKTFEDPVAHELSSVYQSRILLDALSGKIGIDKKSDHIVL